MVDLWIIMLWASLFFIVELFLYCIWLRNLSYFFKLLNFILGVFRYFILIFFNKIIAACNESEQSNQEDYSAYNEYKKWNLQNCVRERVKVWDIKCFNCNIDYWVLLRLWSIVVYLNYWSPSISSGGWATANDRDGVFNGPRKVTLKKPIGIKLSDLFHFYL